GGKLVHGRIFLRKVRTLLAKGVAEAAARYDAVLTLSFFWGATCGLSDERALSLLEDWCRGHVHQGSRLSGKPKAFLAECLREARHYLAHNGPGWRFRGGGAVTMATLTPADQTV